MIGIGITIIVLSMLVGCIFETPCRPMYWLVFPILFGASLIVANILMLPDVRTAVVNGLKWWFTLGFHS